MKYILITLKEEAYQDFLQNKKVYEYRKRWPNDKVIAYIYVKTTEKKILLKIEFDKPIYDRKEVIAQIAKTEHEEWYKGTLDYYKNHEFGYAIKALNIRAIEIRFIKL